MRSERDEGWKNIGNNREIPKTKRLLITSQKRLRAYSKRTLKGDVQNLWTLLYWKRIVMEEVSSILSSFNLKRPRTWITLDHRFFNQSQCEVFLRVIHPFFNHMQLAYSSLSWRILQPLA
ncbi:hypothetical protein J6590_079464 [Homalodisca vitripennis]|nr:hypothetical protein J6590_079464 [Homalodisca vitripennis]